MFHLTTCPTCQTKFTIPEAAVGHRQICPHCQSPFLAGKSLAVADVPMRSDAAAGVATAGAAGYNKTLLGEQQPPIRYNCPRCKKALEAPAIESGTKKPCPYCGQRLQVPAAPVAATAEPNLNKTLLASDESKVAAQPPIHYNCPNCKRPLESPASEAGTKKPCPYCSQRLQVPAASSPAAAQPNLNKTLLASDERNAQHLGIAAGQPATSPGGPNHTPGAAPAMPGTTVPASAPAFAGLTLTPQNLRKIGIVAGGILLLLILFLLITAPGASSARQEAEKQKKELEDLRKEIEQRENQIKQEQRLAALQNAYLENTKKEFERQQDEVNKKFQIEQLKYLNDKQKEAELEAERKKELNRIAKLKDDAELKKSQEAAETKLRLELLQSQLNQANKQSNVIIHSPPPPYYYRYHPYYGWGHW